jgi:hypothetical protein
MLGDQLSYEHEGRRIALVRGASLRASLAAWPAAVSSAGRAGGTLALEHDWGWRA